MADLLSFFLTGIAGLFAIPVCLFTLEIIAAISTRQLEVPTKNGFRSRIAVLVPAHNESVGLLDTLNDIKAQLRFGDRLLVVADNCSDDTAAVAKATGAEVTERNDPARIGKGYALAWGIQCLGADPPATAIVIDADCRLASQTLDYLENASVATNRPVQALYLMTAPDESAIDHRVAAFAFRVKNCVRPLGLRRLGLPCQLMGTGMAFPWEIISAANLATGAAVEDLELGLELARAGRPALFCPSARVTSQFPLSVGGAESQRKRWEQGHAGVIIKNVPRLVYESLVEGNFSLLALALDAAIPPLTLLGMLLSIMFLGSGLGTLFGFSFSAFMISLANLSAYTLAVGICWLQFGRDTLPLSSILSVFTYIARKLPLYRQIFSRGGSSRWIRTDRKGTRENLN
jgi:cellulose synthase/poly-beta-1,6-N-acetylglucosamine synthase-like glycosyltransferase